MYTVSILYEMGVIPMGKMNLLKANWEGKVGQTVGAKWKSRSTIRTYTKPSNPNTQAQRKIRTGFSGITSFVALFADQIRYVNALNTASMSARNAIIKLNKAQVTTGAFDPATLLISKGGLQIPQAFTVTTASGVASASWTPPTATNFTDEAKGVVVVVDEEGGIVDVFEALASAGAASGSVALTVGNTYDAYMYFLDKRGSNKVASNSVYATGTVA